MIRNTFSQKLIMCIASGFAAACLIWVFRHVVERAFYESNEGWREMFNPNIPHHSH